MDEILTAQNRDLMDQWFLSQQDLLYFDLYICQYMF